MHVDVKYARIPMKDGTVLAAKIWLPECATKSPVPSVFEYIPYRWSDGTPDIDATHHPQIAKEGYACLRVDIRGTGNSTGILQDEYHVSELDDAIEVIEWIARQDWCTGKIGMMGYSWGGIIALQVAARRPEALKAVISACSSDDLYQDDVHYMGGCPTTDDASWNNMMMALLASPPDPGFLKDQWEATWKKRLNAIEPLIFNWLSQQRNTDYFRNKSVCSDYSAIEVPVLAIGGWNDRYVNTVFRLYDNLPETFSGVVGPWSHGYPHITPPGPQMDFVEMATSWWDRWLKKSPEADADWPRLKCYVEHSQNPSIDPVPSIGHWVELQSNDVGKEPQFISLANWRVSQPEFTGASMKIRTAPQSGLAIGRACPLGRPGELPGEQSSFDEQCGYLESEELSAPETFVGQPRLRLRLKCTGDRAQIACRLSEVLPDGQVRLISYCVQNLVQRHSSSKPKLLDPGEWFDAELPFRAIGRRIGANSRLRLSFSTTLWPIVWPERHPVDMEIDLSKSCLQLPALPSGGETSNVPHLNTQQVTETSEQGVPDVSISAGAIVLKRRSEGLFEPSESNEGGAVEDINEELSLNISDVFVGAGKFSCKKWFEYDGSKIQINAETAMEGVSTGYRITAKLLVTQNGNSILEKQWQREIGLTPST